jgi:hypothetical protein
MPRFLLVLLLVVPTVLVGQGRPDAPAVGVELSAYPAGIIASARFTIPTGRSWSFEGTVGLNLTDRRDFGEHDNEEGEGPGAGIGIRWSEEEASGWFLGARVEVWRLTIDWRDDPARTGETEVTVLQPTLRGGHGWNLGAGRFRFEVGGALGVEINASTTGEPVGKGAILLGGLALLYRF